MIEIFNKYYDAIIETDKNMAISIINDALYEGYKAEKILFEVVVPSIDKMMNQAYQNESNLAQHFICSQIAKMATDILVQNFDVMPVSKGIIVIGTSPGDFHGLGKKIVEGCLRAYMIDIVDLGLNVNAEKFVDEAIKNNAQIIAISSMMVHTAKSEDGCIGVRRLLKEKNLEDKIKVVVGGAPFKYDENLWKDIGADGWAENGIEGSKLILKFIEEVNLCHR